MDDLLRRRKWAKSPRAPLFLREIRNIFDACARGQRSPDGSEISYGTCCIFVGTALAPERWFGEAGERSFPLMANNQPNQPREQQRQAQPGREPMPDKNRPSARTSASTSSASATKSVRTSQSNPRRRI
jgi:hypothetical protein